MEPCAKLLEKSGKCPTKKMFDKFKKEFRAKKFGNSGMICIEYIYRKYQKDLQGFFLGILLKFYHTFFVGFCTGIANVVPPDIYSGIFQKGVSETSQDVLFTQSFFCD